MKAYKSKMLPLAAQGQHVVWGQKRCIRAKISQLLRATIPNHINNKWQGLLNFFFPLTHVQREVWGGYWRLPGWPCDGDMRRWEVNPRRSYMNLPRAFVSSTIEGPRLPKSHLKVTKSHFSCQSLFIEPQDKGQRGAHRFWELFIVSNCPHVHYHTCLGEYLPFLKSEMCQTQNQRFEPQVNPWRL